MPVKVDWPPFLQRLEFLAVASADDAAAAERVIFL
jgi:hypothetical protein